jgi:hypothetical protein
MKLFSTPSGYGARNTPTAPAVLGSQPRIDDARDLMNAITLARRFHSVPTGPFSWTSRVAALAPGGHERDCGKRGIVLRVRVDAHDWPPAVKPQLPHQPRALGPLRSEQRIKRMPRRSAGHVPHLKYRPGPPHIHQGQHSPAVQPRPRWDDLTHPATVRPGDTRLARYAASGAAAA